VLKEEGINESSIIYDATIVVMREDVGWRREKTLTIRFIVRLQLLIEVEE
jgi:hypothetical protein